MSTAPGLVAAPLYPGPQAAGMRTPPVIRRLPPGAVNQIAAGEVIERPAAAVKELTENAIDAGATAIDIAVETGGIGYISVRDDGCGMDAPSLRLALERHATSKLEPDDAGDFDLLDIRSLGFRGEALPSLGSVARLTLTSRPRGAEAHAIDVAGGVTSEVRPAALAGWGTLIEVRDLFFATPARLNFLKSPRAESMAVAETVKALALTRPDIAFSLHMDGRLRFRLPAAGRDAGAALARQAEILGAAFADNAMAVTLARGEAELSGYAGLPTFSRGQADRQYLFVNGRPVRDRLFIGAVRAAYADFLPRDRHPQLVLALTLPPTEVDVNVHPAKAEVRFRHAADIRALIISGLRTALANAGHRASTTIAAQALMAMMPHRAAALPPGGLPDPNAPLPGLAETRAAYRLDIPDDLAPGAGRLGSTLAPSFGPVPGMAADGRSAASAPADEGRADALPLGLARAQLHETYIIAQTATGMVIVDQHAAHERLLYERMKAQQAAGGVVRQALLVPELIEPGHEEAQALIDAAADLAQHGLVLESFGAGAILVREVPALFGQGDVRGLVLDVAADLLAEGQSRGLADRLASICGNMACRAAVKAGRRLGLDEMNALLRAMEATPHAGQCNHGRPTYVALPLRDIERLFGRR